MATGGGLREGKKLLNLRQFMLRGEIIGLYKNFLRLGRVIEGRPRKYPLITESPEKSSNDTPEESEGFKSTKNAEITKHLTGLEKLKLRQEWNEWVRSEFRMRMSLNANSFNIHNENNAEEEEKIVRHLLVHGQRQLKELEKTMCLALNENVKTESK